MQKNCALLVQSQQVLRGLSFYRMATVSALQLGSKHNALDALSLDTVARGREPFVLLRFLIVLNLFTSNYGYY